MEKYITETTKWFEDNQNASNAQELFTQRIKEAEDFFAPFYANATGKEARYTISTLMLILFSLETDANNPNPSRNQLHTPKSGKK